METGWTVEALEASREHLRALPLARLIVAGHDRIADEDLLAASCWRIRHEGGDDWQ